MDYKKSNAELNTITRDLRTFEAKTGNLYESVVVVGKRANQLNQEIKEELTGKLADFASHTDNLEEIFENREQIEVSKYYERLPKPHAIATQEFMEDKIYFRNPAKGSKSF
ncbi:MAG: DNA-directed RNA polymerase subunit omega [Bacteroidetes bacterium]|nr:DNA-directed RNA polymerase subunit omega [Bacteroidota bacterium]